ncbi:Bromodomain-containing protein [Metschnikowia aff. pulcherrima]|uniref:Bromodomain-containing protein n=1 Tax=Metschnikowia aff. pulcherrima TaxID=2163413 RepID=A0A4P6XL04_9ASCO|nr:Bromodomain-containing protein [Metschnikowia aff. pulcherrima]
MQGYILHHQDFFILEPKVNRNMPETGLSLLILVHVISSYYTLKNAVLAPILIPLATLTNDFHSTLKSYGDQFEYPPQKPQIDTLGLIDLIKKSPLNDIIIVNTVKGEVQLSPPSDKTQATLVSVVVESSIGYGNVILGELQDLKNEYHSIILDEFNDGKTSILETEASKDITVSEEALRRDGTDSTESPEKPNSEKSNSGENLEMEVDSGEEKVEPGSAENELEEEKTVSSETSEPAQKKLASETASQNASDSKSESEPESESESESAGGSDDGESAEIEAEEDAEEDNEDESEAEEEDEGGISKPDELVNASALSKRENPKTEKTTAEDIIGKDEKQAKSHIIQEAVESGNEQESGKEESNEMEAHVTGDGSDEIPETISESETALDKLTADEIEQSSQALLEESEKDNSVESEPTRNLQKNEIAGGIQDTTAEEHESDRANAPDAGTNVTEPKKGTKAVQTEEKPSSNKTVSVEESGAPEKTNQIGKESEKPESSDPAQTHTKTIALEESSAETPGYENLNFSQSSAAEGKERTETPGHESSLETHEESQPLPKTATAANLAPQDTKADLSPARRKRKADLETIEPEAKKSRKPAPRKKSPETLTPAQKYKRFQTIAVNLIKSIEAHRFLLPFLTAVTAREYSKVVKNPKDLKSILKDVKRKQDQAVYTTVKELERDIILMFTNCVMFNRSLAPLVRMAQEMKDDVRTTFKMFEEAEREL